MYTHDHGSTIHGSQKVETVQMFINGWTDKQTVLCTYSGILFSHKKHEVLIYPTQKNLENITLSQKARHKGLLLYDPILYDSLYMKYSA